MKTGTDVSLAECRASGYPVVEHGKSPLDPKKYYSLTISNSRHWPDGHARIGIPARNLYRTDTMTSYADLWEKFMDAGEGIKSFCDFKNCPMPSPDESPSFHDFVNLAGTVESYCGLD